jgi:hypothetical protein
MRTGGTSLREMLWQAYPQESIYPNESQLTPKGRQYPELDRAVAWLRANPAPSLVNGHYPYVLRQLLPSSTKVITLLRDPIDRSISAMRRARRRNERFKAMSFEEVFDDQRFREAMIENYQTKVFGIRQSDEVASVNLPLRMDRGRLRTAIDHLEACDVVGLTEDFEAAVEKVASLGIPMAGGVRANRTPETDNEPIPGRLLDRIRESVGLDVELYERARQLASSSRL